MLRVLRGIGLILLMLILFLLSPVLWPVYLGIAVLCPDTIDKLFRTKIF